VGEPETVIFQDRNVTITSARAVMGDTTYVMSNITSVRQFAERQNVGCMLAIALPLVAVGSVGVQDKWDLGWIFLAGGLGTAAVALAAAWRPKHWVRIGTAGAETNAIWSYDAAWTKRVVDAVNAAIIGRG